MVTILPAPRQVGEDLVKILDQDSTEALCQGIGHEWRDRQLDPWTTLHPFIPQVLNNNTAMTHLPRPSGERFTASVIRTASLPRGPADGPHSKNPIK